jgi:hypothetical protein
MGSRPCTVGGRNVTQPGQLGIVAYLARGEERFEARPHYPDHGHRAGRAVDSGADAPARSRQSAQSLSPPTIQGVASGLALLSGLRRAHDADPLAEAPPLWLLRLPASVEEGPEVAVMDAEQNYGRSCQNAKRIGVATYK